MESQFKCALNGVQVQTHDFDLLGETSGLADDRVFAELFRMAPFDGANASKGITCGARLIEPNGATGSVLVQPFRAFVGSRTAVASCGKKNLRDIRSTIAVGTTTLAQQVVLADNASGNARWDLIYASVTPDAPGSTFVRKFKDPVAKYITVANVVRTLETTVTLQTLQGTPAASPVWPALPADASGVYNVPLAYVRVPNSFTSGSTVGRAGIAEIAPKLAIDESSNAMGVEVPDQMRISGGIGLTTAKVQAWGSSGTRPNMFLPTMVHGGRSMMIPLDLRTGIMSHASGDVIDSRDWRNRMARWQFALHSADFPWSAATSGAFQGGAAVTTSFSALNGNVGMGQTFQGAGNRNIAIIDGALHPTMPDTSTITIYCDNADGGKLKVSYTNAPNCSCIFWIDFTAPFHNVG